jgi:hypothetical protein
VTASDGTDDSVPSVGIRDAYGMTVGDHNVVIQRFLIGINRLPTDYGQRIENFLVEYLGTSSQPVPFGGRSGEMEALDSWLAAEDAAPYLLLFATAGRGKSALLVRWTRGLLERGDVTVAFIPVSIRYRTNLSGVFFPALAARLAHIHDDEVPRYSDAPAEVWRGVVSGYLARPLPDGRRLLVVLDGLDEAADWEAGADLLPAVPVPGLRVVVSARTTSAMPAAADWLRGLGWERPGLATSQPLEALRREDVLGIVNACAHDAVPSGELRNLANQLHRLSEGDPLLISLYLRDLFSGDGSVMADAAELAKTPSGLEGFFDRWWDDQRHWWESHFGRRETLQIETQVHALMALFSHGLGPLSRDDLTELNPTLPRHAIEPALAPLTRFLVGDGLRQGYVLSHSRLGEYWKKRHVTEAESRQLEQRFVEYGLNVARSLRERRLGPEDASPYVVQYLGAHLGQSRADVASRLLLIHESWRRAWHFVEGTDTGFLADVRSCRRSLRTANARAQATGEIIPYLAEEILCVLCENSVIDQTRHISPELLSALVSRGMWSGMQALVYARQIPDPASSANALLAVAAEIPPQSRRAVLAEAMEVAFVAFRESSVFPRGDLLESVIGRAAALGGTSEAWSAIERLPGIDITAYVLAQLAQYPDEEHQAEACALFDRLDRPGGLFESADESSANEWGPVILAALAPHLPGEHREEVYRRAVDWVTGEKNVSDRASTIRRLVGLLPRQLVPELLAAARRGHLGHRDTGRALCAIAPCLAAPLREEVVSEAFARQLAAATHEHGYGDTDQVASALAYIADGYPEHLASLVVDEALGLGQDWPRTAAIAGLLASMQGEQRERLNAAADKLPHHLMKCRVYTAAACSETAPEHRARLALRALREAFDSGDHWMWAETLAYLATTVPQLSLPSLVDIADGLQVRTARLAALTTLTGMYGTVGLGEEALAVVARLSDARDRASLLLTQIDQLPLAARPELVRQIADAVANSDLQWLRTRVRGLHEPIAWDVAEVMLASLLGRPASGARDWVIGLVLSHRDPATPLAPGTLTAVLEVAARKSARSRDVADILAGLAKCGHDEEAAAILHGGDLEDEERRQVLRTIAVAARGERAEAVLAQELAAGVPDGWVLYSLVEAVSAGSVGLIERAIPDLRSTDQVDVATAVAQRLRREGQPDRALRCLCLPERTVPDVLRPGLIAELIPEATEETVSSLLGTIAWLIVRSRSRHGTERIAVALPESLRIKLFEALKQAGSGWPDALLAAARVAATLPPGHREPAVQAIWSQAASAESEQVPYEAGHCLVSFLPADEQTTVAADLLERATRRQPVSEKTWVRISALLPFLRPCELAAAVPVMMRSGATSPQDIAVLSERLAAAGEPDLLRAYLPQAHGRQRQTLLLGLASGSDDDAAAQMVTEALQIARRISDEESSLPVLAAMVGSCPQEERPSLLDRCLRAYRNWSEGTDSPAMLEVLVPQLSAEDQKSILINAVARWDLTSDDPAKGPLWATVVRLMALHDLGQTALETVAAMPAGDGRETAFQALLPALPAELLDEALKIARSVPVGENGGLRTKLLAAVAVRLESPARETVVTEALGATKDYPMSLVGLGNAISALPQLTGANLETAVKIARQNPEEIVLRPLFKQLDAGRVRALLPDLLALPREASVKAVRQAALRLYQLGQVTEGFDLLMTHVPPDDIMSVVDDLMPMPGEALSRLQELVPSSRTGSYQRADAICALTPYVSEDTLEKFQAEAESMDNHHQARFYAELARRTSGQESRKWMESALDTEKDHVREDLLSELTPDLFAPVARIADILPVDLAARAVGVLISAKTLDHTSPLKLVCERIAQFSPQEQFRIIADIFEVVERASRAQTLFVVRHLLPTLTALAGTTVATRLFNVIDEVISSWP